MAITQGLQTPFDGPIRWKGPNGERVRVINMSLGGPIVIRSNIEQYLEACAAGILVVVASGNEGDADENTMEYGYPALYNECITVAACDRKQGTRLIFE